MLQNANIKKIMHNQIVRGFKDENFIKSEFIVEL